jgi:hypothetical protein
MGKMRSKNLLHFLSMICLSNEGQPIAHAQAFVAQNLWSYKREGNMKRFCWNNDLSDEMRLSVQVALAAAPALPCDAMNNCAPYVQCRTSGCRRCAWAGAEGSCRSISRCACQFWFVSKRCVQNRTMAMLKWLFT